AWTADQRLAAAQTSDFAGRWDLTVTDANKKQLPSWLELSESNGSWQASFVGRWGNARPLPKVMISGEKLEFVSPKEEEASRNDLVFEGKLTGGKLIGSAKGPNGATWTWTAKRAPALQRRPTIKWGEAITLFNGYDFAGWRFDNPAM